MYKCYYVLIFLMGFSGNLFGYTEPTRTFPRQPSHYREAQLKEIENAFQNRSKKFLKKEQYIVWEMDKPSEIILKEFDQLNAWRQQIYYVDPTADTLESQKEFMISQALLNNHRYRKPHLIAFQYNNTDTTYNSSTITLNGLKFLALEAPSKTSVESFFNLLHNFHVTHLIRLTPAMENKDEKSYPYWEENVDSIPSTQETFLKIPLESEENNPIPYKLHYIWIDTWKDHQSGSPEDLLRLILQTRKGLQPSSLIAVHCHSGVARAGTFIAGFILLNEIDQKISEGKTPKNLNISIEKVVKELSLQRFYMVGKPTQYLTLYRLVDLYIKNLQREKN